ncbi:MULTISPECIES: shikimate kinase [Butyricimonas]|uniref:shikimate kinase n=1 Tax=Butyricimonas TaxID=574697 RepID=UPI00257A2828|nr:MULTISPECIES: shikimate kinase [Butyricimonas]
MAGVISMKYFIVGYMASGKSTFGKELAKDKGLPFLDLDECVESREGRSISEIFAKEGEEYFRKREREILHEICNEADEFVLATGGGTPCFFDNMDYMNQAGTTVFLNTSPLVIVDRLKRQRADRPLLAMYSDDELEFFVREHLESRLSFYLKAKEQV